MISQQPAGHGATVAVRVKSPRRTVTAGAVEAGAAVPGDSTTRSTSIPGRSPGELAITCAPAPSATADPEHVRTDTGWPATSAATWSAPTASGTGAPSTVSRSSRHAGCTGTTAGVLSIAGASSSVIATGSVVRSPYRRSTVALGSTAVPSIVIDGAATAGSATVLAPPASGAGTSRSTVSPPTVTRTPV